MVGHHNLNWSLAFNIPTGVATVSDLDLGPPIFSQTGPNPCEWVGL